VKTPYGFQQEALDKGIEQPSFLCGDEMGLGKTPFGIWRDRDLRHKYIAEHGKVRMKTLIVAPLAVHETWEKHVQELLGAPVVRIDPKNRDAFVKKLAAPVNGFYIVHWQALRLLPELKDVSWFHIIADEVHRAKNRKAQQTQSLKYLQTMNKTGLSGTPADDKPDDLWSVINWLHPTYYRSYWRFRKHYCEEEIVETKGLTARAATKVVGVKNVESLHKEIDPWFIRRLKKDVLEELPDKYYSTVWVDLHPKQRRAYEQMKRDMIAWLDHQDFTSPLIAGVVVAQLTRLQQFALGYMSPHPTKNGKWIMTDPSAKLDVLCEIIEDNPNEPIVVFSQSKAILHLFSQRLDRMKVKHGLYTGDQKQVDKDRVVAAFQAGDLQIFAGTIQAGGEGITLTASSTLVFLDRAWKPTANLQVEDRCHRIGQKNAVQIIDIMAKNTVDPDRKIKIDLKHAWLRQLLGDDK
jgi:SNF2 family DNA or RNA helicase